MPLARRSDLDDRRRLVIHCQNRTREPVVVSAPQRQSADGGNSGRSSMAAYGSRVQRRLRARWYGVVPVRRRAMTVVALVIFAMVGIMGLGHWAALWWEPLANRPDLARPLRLDRPDSFGTWLGAVVLALSAGASLLVYQLRRYRSDDYYGHYRLWRVMMLLCLIASVDCVTRLSAWVGSGLDVLLQERDVLAGADWIRLLLFVSGAAFGIRMTAEVGRNRLAAAGCIGTLLLLASPMAVRWNFVRWEMATAVTWLPILVLAGRGMLLASVVIYLRMLYREVRRLEGKDRLADRLRALVPRRRPKETAAAESRTPPRRKRAVADSSEKVAGKEGTSRRQQPSKEADATKTEVVRADRKAGGDRAGGDRAGGDRAREEDGSEGAVPERRGLWGRRRESAGSESAEAGGDRAREEDGSEGAVPERRGLWGRRRETAGSESAEAGGDRAREEDGSEGAVPKRRGLWGRRRESAGSESAEAGGDRAREEDGSEGAVPKRRRLWGRRRESAGSESAEAGGDRAREEDGSEGAVPKRRGLWGRRTRVDEKPESNADELVVEKKRFKLWGRKVAASETDVSDAVDQSDSPAKVVSKQVPAPARSASASGTRPTTSPANSTSQGSARSDSGDDEDGDDDGAWDEDQDIDPDGIDWANLNKSERRRMRKLLKRQGKAA